MILYPRQGSLVFVRWKDAAGFFVRRAGDSDCPLDPLEAETVGWIFKRTRQNLYVACERLPADYVDRYRGTTRIPIGWITEIVKIA